MSKVDQNIEKFVKYIVENNIILSPSPKYFEKKSGRYVNKQLTEEYQNLENKIFDVLLENNKDANKENLITKRDLEVELALLVKDVKVIGLKNIDMNAKIRKLKKNIKSKCQNTITYFLPVFNLNITTSEEKLTSEINIYSSKDVLTQINDKDNKDYNQIKKYLNQPDSVVLGIKVKGYGDGNKISLNKAIALGQLFVSLVNSLVDIDGLKCVLVRDISYAEEKYSTFSGWQAVKEDYNQIKKYLNQPDSVVLGIKVKGYGDGNKISLNKAIALGQLFVSLVNSLVDIDGLKCVLVRDISYAEEKYSTFSGWQAVKEVNSFVSIEGNPNVSNPFLMPNNIKKFTFIFDPRNNRELQIRNAIRWLGESLVDDNINNAYIKAMIALESVAEVKPDLLLSPSITNQISVMTALLTEENVEKRVFVREQLKNAYENRSKLVHGIEKNISYSDYVFVANIVKKMIQELSLNSKYTQYSKIKELWEHLTNRMLSADLKKIIHP